MLNGAGLKAFDRIGNEEPKMIDELFAAIPGQYVTGIITRPTTYYFSVDDIKKTVRLDSERAIVEDGKTVEDADCVCKTSAEFLAKIWRDDYRPGVMDFMSGKIKSNDPAALETFLRCFGKA
jgi:hypothetical protein